MRCATKPGHGTLTIDARAEALGDPDGPVGRAGVDDHDLVAERHALQGGREAALLVERDQHGRERRHAGSIASRRLAGGRPAACRVARPSRRVAPMDDPFSRSFSSAARCSRGISCSPPACTLRATCSARWCSCDPPLATRLGGELADAPAADPQGRCSPTAVVAPALGGVLVAHEVARGLGCRGLFTERQDGAMTLRRGFTCRPASRWSSSRTSSRRASRRAR